MVNLQEGLLPGLSQTFRVKLKTMQRLNHRSFGSRGIGFPLRGVFWSLLALSLASQLLPGQVTQVLADGPVVQAKTAPAPAKGQPSVVLITLDGLPATFLRDPAVSLPNLRRLAQQGVAAEGMVVANPSVTWPNHTTLITGVYPATHGVLFNGVLQRPGLGLPPKTEAKRMAANLLLCRHYSILPGKPGWRLQGLTGLALETSSRWTTTCPMSLNSSNHRLQR